MKKQTTAYAVIAVLFASFNGAAAIAGLSGNMVSGGSNLQSTVPARVKTNEGAQDDLYSQQYPTYATYKKADKTQTVPQKAQNYTIGSNATPGTTSNEPSVQMPNEQPQEQESVPPPTAAKNQPNSQSHWYYNKFPNPDAPFPIDPYHEQMPYVGNCGTQMACPAQANSAFVDAMPILNDDPAKQTYVTDAGAQAALLCAVCKQAANDNAPKHKVPGMMAQQQGQARGASEAAADGAEATEAAAITEAMLGLINVANENAAVPGAAQQSTKILPQAIWMVQQMFHGCYIPMAILLLLPGALMTQMKAMVQYGFLSGVPEDEEMRGPSPFVGIFRSIIAIFLIPATQLIVSWMIDIGNSMTYEVEKYLIPAEVMNWMKEQTYNPPTQNDENNLNEKPSDDQTENSASNDAEDPQDTGSGVEAEHAGKAQNATEAHSSVRDQQLMTQTMQAGFNIAALTIAGAFAVLLAFQTVMMCYLFLLGPIAAAFYAWPSGVGSLFKKVFINWVDAVINLALWRFWWVVVVLIMYVRIEYLKAIGAYQPNSQWELAMYTAFMVIICYVPFMPFEFRPGEMVSKVLEKAEQAGKGGGGGGGGGGEEGGGQQQTPQATPNNSPNQHPQPSNGNRQAPAPAPAPPPGFIPRSDGSVIVQNESGGGHNSGHENDSGVPNAVSPPPLVNV